MVQGGKKSQPNNTVPELSVILNWIIGIPMVFENLIIVIPPSVIISSFPPRHEN